ncbi:hypothetical protein NDU88_000207 [Pleurodeles waltl]|uniref:Uncharacterized protein n=1 Tax=Pleurodeles waltl TaxID=8319 RepID=A0AAV7P076_PLEWA|nr:hypothetical protein NDU88_000207 [Pleurodeles waltl]
MSGVTCSTVLGLGPDLLCPQPFLPMSLMKSRPSWIEDPGSTLAPGVPDLWSMPLAAAMTEHGMKPTPLLVHSGAPATRGSQMAQLTPKWARAEAHVLGSLRDSDQLCTAYDTWDMLVMELEANNAIRPP